MLGIQWRSLGHQAYDSLESSRTRPLCEVAQPKRPDLCFLADTPDKPDTDDFKKNCPCPGSRRRPGADPGTCRAHRIFRKTTDETTRC